MIRYLQATLAFLLIAAIATAQPCTPTGNETSFGTGNVWIGYGYNNLNFTSYRGFINVGTAGNANFDTDFGGNNGNLNTIFTDRWHRADPFDVNSEWIAGKYPANRYNIAFGHSNYEKSGQRNSSFWMHNVTQFRARTIQLGYTLPKSFMQRVKIQRARVYLNAFNLFSFDNLKDFAVDPEVVDDNGLQFPQNRVINVGINLSL